MFKRPNSSFSYLLKPSVSKPTKSFISEIYYNRKLEEKISSVEFNSSVDLSYWNLIDQDISLITKQIIINKQCTDLYLCGNKITSQGTLILSLKLANNSTLKTLDLSYNPITDGGIHSLSQILLPHYYSSIEKLYLNKNSFSNDGISYLSEMLKTNQTLKELSLSDNEISDEGLKQLTNVLIYYNRTLEVLILSFNIFITDLCIDNLIKMLEYNPILKQLSIHNCNLSEHGKMKLQEIAQRKNKFQIEI